MEQLTIPSSADKLKVTQEAINQHIRNKRSSPDSKNETFFIYVKKNKLRVKIVDGIPFILFSSPITKDKPKNK